MIYTYLIIFSLFSVVFLIFLRLPLLASQSVLFYRGNLLLLLTFFLTLTIIFIIYKRIKIGFETLLAALVMSASIHLSLFVVFPVTFDRSVTMYLLNRLQVSNSPTCSGLSPQAMENLFIKEYVKRDQAMARRIYEQSQINILQQNQNCVKLTKRGQDFLQFSKIIKKIYDLN